MANSHTKSTPLGSTLFNVRLPPADAVPQAQAAAVVSYDPDTEGFVDTDGQRGVFVSGRPQGNGPEKLGRLDARPAHKMSNAAQGDCRSDGKRAEHNVRRWCRRRTRSLLCGVVT